MKQTDKLLGALLVAAHRLTRIAAQATGSTTPSAVWNTLSILSTDGALRVGELATAARVAQPTMTKVVNQLVSDLFVERMPDPHDSRAWLVSVTPAGLDELIAWRNTLAAELEPMFAGISAVDRATLTRAVDILNSRTTAEQGAA